MTTPVELRAASFGNVWLKRDDLFEVAGVRGGKVRTAWTLMERERRGVVTAGSRSSPQCMIVARLAQHLGIPCRIFTPNGAPGPEILQAEEAGACRVPVIPGYNSVLIKRSREDARERGWSYVPFGMECEEAVTATAEEVVNIPAEVKRVVVPVGSAMSLAGILVGLLSEGRTDLPVLGVVVGADPISRLNMWAPPFWPAYCRLVPSGHKYDTRITGSIGGVDLDSVYEAKCIPFLEPDDLLWIVGHR